MKKSELSGTFLPFSFSFVLRLPLSTSVSTTLAMFAWRISLGPISPGMSSLSSWVIVGAKNTDLGSLPGFLPVGGGKSQAGMHG